MAAMHGMDVRVRKELSRLTGPPIVEAGAGERRPYVEIRIAHRCAGESYCPEWRHCRLLLVVCVMLPLHQWLTSAMGLSSWPASGATGFPTKLGQRCRIRESPPEI